MQPRHSLLVATIALVGVALAVAGSPVAAQEDAEEELEVVDGHVVDTPERTVDLDQASGQFTVDSVLVVEPGESFGVDVTVPEEHEGSASLDLYNSEEDVEDFHREISSGVYELPNSQYGGDRYPPGTYALGLETDSYQDLLPVVVQGYDLTVDAPDEVEQGETATVTVDVHYAALEDSPADVAVALHHDGEPVDASTTDFEATEDGERYEATLDLADGAAPGTYDVYAAARGDDQVEDSRTALAVDGGATIDVSEGTSDGNESGGENDTDDSETDDGDDGSNAGGGIPAPDDGDEDGSQDDDGGDGSGDESSDDGSEPDDRNGDGTDSDETDDGSGEAGDGDDAAPGDGEDDEVIEPNSDDGDEDDEQSDETPGFGVLAVLAALLAVVGRAASADS